MTRRRTSISSPNSARCNTCASASTTPRKNSRARNAGMRSSPCATRSWRSWKKSRMPRARRISPPSPRPRTCPSRRRRSSRRAAAPAGEEASINGFAAAAYKLTPQDPDSDVPLSAPLQAPEAFYVLHLSGVTPARPLTLERGASEDRRRPERRARPRRAVRESGGGPLENHRSTESRQTVRRCSQGRGANDGKSARLRAGQPAATDRAAGFFRGRHGRRGTFGRRNEQVPAVGRWRHSGVRPRPLGDRRGAVRQGQGYVRAAHEAAKRPARRSRSGCGRAKQAADAKLNVQLRG